MDKIQENVPLAEYTTFKIGGPAKYFIEAEEKQDILDAFEWARNKEEAVFILGGGSNVLVSDDGVDGLVVKLKNNRVSPKGDRLYCGAGASLSRINISAISNGLSGLEWSVGIPGATIGGAVRGNAGAFGSEIAEVVETVEVFDPRLGKQDPFSIYSNRDCRFQYRSSVFKQGPSMLIWEVVLKMRKINPEEIKEKTGQVLDKRRETQPNLPNAGCIFKNLFIEDIEKNSPKLAEYIKRNDIAKQGKVAAGWLIDTCGLKGRSLGGAKVSLEHANFIVNRGKATALDIIGLISYIKKEVYKRFNLELEEEVQFLGINSYELKITN
jgi:UDP-N-acetylmuramate dehydrogenase